MKSDNNLNRFSARSVLNLFTLNSPANGGVQLGSGPEPAAPPFLPRPEVSGIIRVKGANHLSPYLYREDHSRAGPDTPAAWGRALFLPPSEYPPGAGALSRDPGPEISASSLFPGESCRPLMPGLSGGDRLPPLPPYFRDGLPDIFIPPGPPDSFPLTDNDNPERRATYVERGSRLADHHPGLDYPGALAWPPGDLAEIILAWTLEITEPGGNPFRLWLGFFIPGTFFDIFFPPPRPPVPLPASGWLFLSGLVGLALKFLGRKKKL